MSDEVNVGMNFGRRIPTQEEVVEEPVVVEQPKVKEKKEPSWAKPVVSKELFTEINLFVPQIIGLVFSVLIGLATILMTRVMSIGLVENLKPQISEEIYLQLSTNFNAWNNFVLIGVAVPILIYAGFLLVKFLFMLPRKDRNIVVRIFNARAILFSIENIKPIMLFNPKEKKTEVVVDNPSKHYDYLNGRPVVFMGQEDRNNISVIREDVDPSGKGRDIDSMVGNALHTGYEIAREQLAQREDKTKIMLILMIVILAGLGLVGFMVIRTPDTVIQGVAGIIGATSTVVPPVA
jgi:hypothetical protein